MGSPVYPVLAALAMLEARRYGPGETWTSR